jgi:DNA-binding CsgD family transcriptional regulator
MKVEIKVGEVNNLEELTHTQERVLAGCCNGLSPKKISKQIGISPTKVVSVRMSLFDIFAVDNPTMLCHAAVLNGVVKLDIS